MNANEHNASAIGHVNAAGVIGRLRVRLAAYLTLKTAIILAAALAMTILLTVAADAVVILPESVRAAGFGVLIGVGLLVVTIAAWAMVRLTPTNVARRFEAADPTLGSKLTNAVQLADGRYDAPVTTLLARRAVELGSKRARSLSVWSVVRRGLAVAVCVVALTAALWGIGLTMFGEVIDAVWPRLTDPHGDHPPYSRVKLAIDPDNAKVLYGGQYEVRATVAGAPVEQLRLIAIGQSGLQTETTMFRRADGSYFQTLTNLREPATFYVTDGRARSYRHAIEILYTPKIELVEVNTTYPAYTALAARTRKLTEPELRVPAGSTMAFTVTSNRPLAGGTLTLTPVLGGAVRTITLAPANGSTVAVGERGGDGESPVVAGAADIEEALAFDLSVTDVEGLVSTEHRKGRIVIDPDRGPRIVVMEPGRHAVATPSVAIPVHVRAEDDYAVERVLWFRGLNRSIERPVTMHEIKSAGAGKVDARGSFTLGDLGVRPGDKIEYFFEAVDNYPAGPNVATSRIYTLEIISEQQYRDYLRSMHAQKALFEQYSAISNMLRRLAERASTLQQASAKAAANPSLTDAEKAELARMADELAKDLAQFEQMARQAADAPQMFDVEEAFKQMLEAQQAAVDAARRSLERATGAAHAPPFDPDALRDVAEQLARMAGELEQNVGEPVKQIAAVARLMAGADSFVRLTQQQEQIARLSKRFEDKPGPLSRREQSELQELADAQRRNRDGLDRLVDQIKDQLAQLPPDAEFDPLREDVRKFLDAVADAKIPADLADAAQKLAGLDGPGGHPVAQRAWEKMDALVEKLQPGQVGQVGQACMRFSPAVMRTMGSTLAQIMQALNGRGQDGGGGSGSGLTGEDVGLYGPDMQLAGQQQAGPGDQQTGATASAAPVAGGEDDDPALLRTDATTTVRLQRDARFPLRYRDLVGDYFRSVAESEQP